MEALVGPPVAPLRPAYTYLARVVSIHDGDSITVEVDLGMRVSVRTKLRLRGIDAPELGTEAGRAAKAHLHTLIPVGSQVLIETAKDPQDKYGRWLAHIYIGDYCVNARMVSDGMARTYDGGTRVQP